MADEEVTMVCQECHGVGRYGVDIGLTTDEEIARVCHGEDIDMKDMGLKYG